MPGTPKAGHSAPTSGNTPTKLIDLVELKSNVTPETEKIAGKWQYHNPGIS